MTEQAHVVAGLVATGIGALGYIPYYRDIFRGSTKPHPFTWFGFAIINAITFVAQVVAGAGPGAWVSGLTTVATLGITVLAFRKGEKQITTFDWVCFLSSLLAIVLWRLTANPLWAVVVVTVADALAFAPTFRKAYSRPYEETPTLYVFSTMKYGVSLLGLRNFNMVTAFFPLGIIPLNMAIVFLIFIRRRSMRREARI